jgi:hypothetical protein
LAANLDAAAHALTIRRRVDANGLRLGAHRAGEQGKHQAQRGAERHDSELTTHGASVARCRGGKAGADKVAPIVNRAIATAADHITHAQTSAVSRSWTT